jgi:hypothetical protein
MSRSTWVVLAAVLAIVVGVALWLMRAPEVAKTDATITFRKAGSGCDRVEVSPDPIEKKVGAHVNWIIDNQCDAEVTWDITGWKKDGLSNKPVEDPATLPSPAPGHGKRSFALKIKDKAEPGRYKYSVVWSSPGQAQQELDPQLIISK